MSPPSASSGSDNACNEFAIDWEYALGQHQSWLRTVVRSRLDNEHAVDDVMQEIALAVLRQNARPTDVASVAPWLYRVAVRFSINHHRQSGRRRRLLHNAAERANGQLADSGDPRDWVLHQEVEHLTATAVSELAPRDRIVIMLKYTEGWSYQQMADHLGVSVKTIEYRLLRARKQLRRRLRQFEDHGK